MDNVGILFKGNYKYDMSKTFSLGWTCESHRDIGRVDRGFPRGRIM